MKKYRLFVCGENFLFKIDNEEQPLGFYTTVYIEAENAEQAELDAIDLLRNDPKLRDGVLNPKSDPPTMFVEEIEEVESFIGESLPRTGFAFFPYNEAIGSDSFQGRHRTN